MRLRRTIALLSLAVVGLVGFIVLSDDGNGAMTPEQNQMIETVVLGNVVVAMQTTHGESGGDASIYEMSSDGKTILWNRT